MLKTIFYIISSLFFLVSTNSYSGSVEGPHLVWFNLSPNNVIATAVDDRLRKFVNGGEKLCWDESFLLFMNDRPTAITRQLVTDAVISKDKVAQKKIDFLLKKPFGEATSGFDGMVVYVDGSMPRLFGITRNVRKMQSFPVKMPEYLEGAFCNVIPDIVRLP